MTRSDWTSLSDAELLRQCETDTYRASGPGGQKRNKTSSAVRLRHPPSGLLVIAEESRSQHENRARALRRLRQAFFLHLREPPTLPTVRTLNLGKNDPAFWPTVGVALDLLDAHAGRLAEAAAALGTTTAPLVDFLRVVPKVWQRANELRAQHGQKPLH